MELLLFNTQMVEKKLNKKDLCEKIAPVSKASYFNNVYDEDFVNEVKKLIKCEDWKTLFYAHLNPFDDHTIIDLLEFLQNKIPNEIYWEILCDVLSGEAIFSERKEQTLNLINNENKDLSLRPKIFMSKEELETLSKLDDNIKIYRGTNKDNKEGFFWTIDLDIAKYFAERHSYGIIYETQINKKYIIAYFESRGEKTILLDPNNLNEIKVRLELNNKNNNGCTDSEWFKRNNPNMMIRKNTYVNLIREIVNNEVIKND